MKVRTVGEILQHLAFVICLIFLVLANLFVWRDLVTLENQLDNIKTEAGMQFDHVARVMGWDVALTTCGKGLSLPYNVTETKCVGGFDNATFGGDKYYLVYAPLEYLSDHTVRLNYRKPGMFFLFQGEISTSKSLGDSLHIATLNYNPTAFIAVLSIYDADFEHLEKNGLPFLNLLTITGG